MGNKKLYRFAVCHVPVGALDCRTGYTIMTTHRLLSAAKTHLQQCVGRGFFIAERVPGTDNYAPVAGTWGDAWH